jgi:PIN domain nuclease of toxin-antitoxin system
MSPERASLTYGKRQKKHPAKRVKETPPRLVRPLLLDTAVLLWWLHDPARLSRTARLHLNQAEQSTVLVSSVSCWEIGLKAQRGLLELGDSFEGFMRRLESMDGVSILPVDLAIWRQMLDLDWDHRDPADRIIVATAMHNDATLLSSDRVIRAFFSEAVW